LYLLLAATIASSTHHTNVSNIHTYINKQTNKQTKNKTQVSDLLMIRLDRELCACAGDMSQFQTPSSLGAVGPISSRNELAIDNEMQLYGSSEFNRYKLLRDFLDGKLCNCTTIAQRFH
jgi:hypothetical protein